MRSWLSSGRTASQIDQLYEHGVTADRPAPEAIGNYFASTIRPPGPPDHSRGPDRTFDAASEQDKVQRG